MVLNITDNWQRPLSFVAFNKFVQINLFCRVRTRSLNLAGTFHTAWRGIFWSLKMYQKKRDFNKLMQLNRPWAKFCLKTNLNHCLIDFFNANSWSLNKLSRQNWLYLVRFISKKSIYIQNRSNLIKNGQNNFIFY